MRGYWIFRIVTLVCALVVIFVTGLYYFGFVDDKNSLLVSGVFAVLAAIFGIFAAKPIDKGDVSGAVDAVLLTYKEDTLTSLQKAKEEEKSIRDFIEHRSNEIFLIKLRTYLEQDIENRYKDSEIAKLIEELEKVEAKLDEMNVQYGPLNLPERFKELVKDMNSSDRERAKRALYTDLVDSLISPFPYPIDYTAKVILKAFYSFWVR